MEHDERNEYTDSLVIGGRIFEIRTHRHGSKEQLGCLSEHAQYRGTAGKICGGRSSDLSEEIQPACEPSGNSDMVFRGQVLMSELSCEDQYFHSEV